MDTETIKAPDEELAITELVEFEPDRMDGVQAGATGIGFLMLKSVAALAEEPAEAPDEAAKGGLPEWLAELTKAIVRGKVDETQDLDLARQIITLLTKAISLEADELAAGNLGEITDIRMLSDAVSMIKCWQAREQAVADGKDPDDSMLMCSVQVPAGLTGEDVAKAAGELRPPVVAKEGTTVDTVTQREESLTKSDLAEAVTKATGPLKAEIASLQGQVAKVLALPQPGGPVLAVTTAPKKAGPDAEDYAAKAAGYRYKAETVTDPKLADDYRQLAREADDKAATLQQ